MSQKTTLTPALILKRSNIGETDRIVTMLTPELGKITCVAKGCRKMNSSKRGHLEPGNMIDAYLIHTKSLPLLTQTRLTTEFSQLRTHLIGMKRLFQILEIVDTLFVEDESVHEFQHITNLLTELNENPKAFRNVQQKLTELLTTLGYQDPSQTQYRSIVEYVSSVAERPMRSYAYLTVNSSKR